MRCRGIGWIGRLVLSRGGRHLPREGNVQKAMNEWKLFDCVIVGFLFHFFSLSHIYLSSQAGGKADKENECFGWR